MISRLLKFLVGDSDQVVPAIQTSEEHNRVYQQGADLVSSYMRLHGQPVAPINRRAKKDLGHAIKLLEAVITFKPENWAAHWMLGKAHQALGDAEKACDAFGRSFNFEKQNADVAREYAVECLNLGRVDDGIAATEHALSLEPDNAGLIANVALAYLIAGRLSEALRTVDKTLALDPHDEISQRLAGFIRDVEQKKRPQPRNLRDLRS